MTHGVRGVLTLIGFALLAGAAFVATRYWQPQGEDYVRLPPSAPCDLRAGPCRRELGVGALSFSIEPRAIPLMQPLRLEVHAEGLAVDAVTVEIRGLNMDMGLNRTVLQNVDGGRWRGETILPVCSQRRMEWEAALRVDAGGRYELPFPFHTTRP